MSDSPNQDHWRSLEDRHELSLTNRHDSPRRRSSVDQLPDWGTPSPTDELSITACQLATLAQLWLRLPADLRTAIMLMVQPWSHSNADDSHAPLPQQGDPA